MKVMIVERVNNEDPGGFTMRNLGPDKVTVFPGEEFPADWIDDNTLDILIGDGHIVSVAELEVDVKLGDDKNGNIVAEISVTGPEEETPDALKDLLAFEKKDLTSKTRAELDSLLEEVLELAEVEDKEPYSFSKKEDLIKFLAGE